MYKNLKFLKVKMVSNLLKCLVPISCRIHFIFDLVVLLCKGCVVKNDYVSHLMIGHNWLIKMTCT